MITVDQIRDHIPKYLTPEKQAELVQQLSTFETANYYTTLFPTDMLQGDGWSHVEVVRFGDGARDKIKGILLSNSCDIDPTHSRDFPSRIVFAPLVRLNDYVQALKKKDRLNDDQISRKVDAIRKQRVTSLFFLPTGAGLETEHMALLDDLHNIPLAAYQAETAKSKLFTLSQMGFYLFLLKLSIHFCRFQEEITRS